MHAATTLRTTLGPRQGVNNKEKLNWAEGPCMCVQHFILVNFKGRLSVGSGVGGTAWGGGGRCLSGAGRGGGGPGGGGCQTEPYRPGIAKMHHIDPFSTYICHNV